MRRFRWATYSALLVCICPFAAEAQDGDADLAAQAANPIASLISLPLQYNYDCCYGPRDGDKLLLNVQPVIPLSLNDSWNLIVRTILPLQSLQSPTFAQPTRSGFGDTVQSLFFSPKATGGFTWGVGPVFLWPTGSNGWSSRNWGAGITGVALYQSHGWTVGALANQIWGYAKPDGTPEVNATYLQPFVGYTFPDSTGIFLNTETTYDWSNETWSVPINLMVSHIYTIFHQKIQFQVGARYWAETPSGDPDWGGRFTMTFLFPK